MKRITLTFIALFSVIWSMPIFCKAYTQTDFNLKVLDETGVTCGTYSNDVYQYLTEYSTYPFTIEKYSSFIKFVVGSEYVQGVYDYQYEYPSPYYVFQIYYNSNNVGTSVYNTSLFQRYYGNTTDSFVVGQWQNIDEFLATTDFENLFYDPTIPTPNFVVTMERPTPWSNVSTDTNYFDVTWEEYSGYYVQIGYKFSYPNGMKVGLVDGQTTYTPLTYANSEYIDLWALQDMHEAMYINSLVNGNSFELESAMIQDSDSWQTSVPIWANNFNNSAYTKARNNWNTKMRYCWPLFGLRLEIFERLFYVADNVCYVGAWKHWNNTYPTDYNEEIPNNYQVGNSMPGYQNTNNNTDYQEQEYTQTTIGTQTGTNNTPTVVVNNLTPNYPDYPTVATYNHDNILLQMIDTTKRLPSFFGEFTDFCKECLTVLPSEIWEIIAFGFLCSILVMIVKVL